MVEHFASGGEDDLAILVGQRLSAPSRVKNGQTYMRETNFPAAVESIPIGTPVTDSSSHATECMKGDSSRPVPRNPCYSAHRPYSVGVGQALTGCSLARDMFRILIDPNY